MKTYNFAPTEALINSLPAANYLKITERYMDYIGQMPVEQIPTSGIDDPRLTDRIKEINNLNTQYYDRAKKHAALWIGSISHNFADFIDNLHKFATRFDEFYAILSAETGSYKEADALAEVDLLIAHLQQFQLQFQPFQNGIAKDHTDFLADFAKQKALTSSLSASAKALEKKISELRSEFDKDNDEIAKKSGEIFVSDLQDGFSALIAAAGENFGEAIVKSLKMTVFTAKYEIEGIILSAKAIMLLDEIQKLKKEISAEEEALFFLADMGAQLQTILKPGLVLTDFTSGIIGFFQTMKKQVVEVANGTAVFIPNDKDAVTQWQKVATQLEQAANLSYPQMEVLDAGKTKFVSDSPSLKKK